MVGEPGFPAPAAQLTVGRVWLYRDIEAWAQGRGHHGEVLHPMHADNQRWWDTFAATKAHSAATTAPG